MCMCCPLPKIYVSAVLTNFLLYRIKAVSDGAISFYLDHFVRTRVSKLTYGTICRTLYNPSLPEHRERSAKVFITPSGERRIGLGAFEVILPKVSTINHCIVLNE